MHTETLAGQIKVSLIDSPFSANFAFLCRCGLDLASTYPRPAFKLAGMPCQLCRRLSKTGGDVDDSENSVESGLLLDLVCLRTFSFLFGSPLLVPKSLDSVEA